MAVSLLAVFLLAVPIACFAAGAEQPKAMECCLKGSCVPTANADGCCKNSVPDAGQLLVAQAADHSSPLIAIVADHNPTPIQPPVVDGIIAPAKHPPPRLDLTATNLPLLI